MIVIRGRILQVAVCAFSAALPALAAPGYALANDSCAVLPFANAAIKPASAANPKANSANVDWLGLSISETLRDALELRGLVTLDRGDIEESYRRLGLSMRSPLTEASVMKLGEALDAEQVIHGRFEVLDAPVEDIGGSRGSLKISARILDRRRLRESAEFSETGAIEDLATIEAHLAWQALALLAPNLAPEESEFRLLRPPTRLDAEENYIRGLMASAPEQREKLFLQAARLDVRFAHPNFELGQIHFQRKEYRQAADWLQKVGPDEVESHESAFLLGLALFQTGDFAGAQKALEPIAAAVPLSEVYNNLAAAESRRNLPQAVDHFRTAVDGDANDPVYLFNLGYALWRKGDFTGAADQFRATLERDPDDSIATLLLGRCLKKQGFRPGDSGDVRLQGLERLKTMYQERAYRQLKGLLNTPPPAAPRHDP